MALKILKKDNTPQYLRGVLNDNGVGYYIYISNQQWNKSENIIEVTWKVIISNDVIDDEEIESISMQLGSDIESMTKVYVHPVSVEGGDKVIQGYDYLKTLPEFAGATDC